MFSSKVQYGRIRDRRSANYCHFIYTKQKLCYPNDRAAEWSKRTCNKELFKGCLLAFRSTTDDMTPFCDLAYTVRFFSSAKFPDRLWAFCCTVGTFRCSSTITQAGTWSDLSPQPSAKVKKSWSYASTAPYITGTPLLFLLHDLTVQFLWRHD